MIEEKLLLLLLMMMMLLKIVIHRCDDPAAIIVGYDRLEQSTNETGVSHWTEEDQKGEKTRRNEIKET